MVVIWAFKGGNLLIFTKYFKISLFILLFKLLFEIILYYCGSIKFQRKLRASKSELGEFDPAALFESAKSKTIMYYANHESSCLVEQDEEPPHGLDEYAKKTALMAIMIQKSHARLQRTTQELFYDSFMLTKEIHSKVARTPPNDHLSDSKKNTDDIS